MLQFIRSLSTPAQQTVPGWPRALWASVKRKWMLHLLVTLPTLLAVIYYGLIASDIFISETRFVVRQPEKKNLSSLGQFLQSTGITSSHDDMYTVRDFILSRDALRALDNSLDLRKAFSSSKIDFFSRFHPDSDSENFEHFYNYYKDIVTIDVDTASSICIMKVRAYSPEMAQNINEGLLFLGEGLINQLNNRARQDLILHATLEAKEAEEAAKAASLALSGYRNRQTLLDPTQQSTLQLQQVAKLQGDLITVRGQLAQVRSFAAESPYRQALEKQAHELETEIQKGMGKISGDRGSMTQKMTEYERLTLNRDYTDKRLASALASLQEARDQAQRQQLYLTTIVSPNLPDEALFPRRGRDILLVFLCSLLAYGIVRLLYAGVKEHQD